MSVPEPEFPRGRRLPVQSPLFWADRKDRLLRQLLISDMEERTGRHTIVYHTDCSTTALIDEEDDQYILDLLVDVPRGSGVDLILETNGGSTDGTEKIVSILRNNISDLRVVVPRRAKSNGTLLALAGAELVMGPASELGPIDPLILTNDGWLPAHFVVESHKSGAPVEPPVLLQMAEHAIAQTQELAKALLQNGGSRKPKQIEDIVKKLVTRDTYHSHGSVIDAQEAKNLGLNVRICDAEDEYWKWVWLIRCCYEADLVSFGATKIFEGRRVSHMIRPSGE